MHSWQVDAQASPAADAHDLRPIQLVGPVLGRLKEVLPVIEAHAAKLDKDGVYPVDDMRLLHEIGLLHVFAGATATPIELMDALRLLGRVNLSLGRIFEGHVNGLKLVDWYGTQNQRMKLANDLHWGRVYGVWNTEPVPGVRIVDGPHGATLQGRKLFATGTGYIDRAIITALTPEGERQMIAVDVSDWPSRADASAWQVRGMKATVSGSFDFSGLSISADDFLGRPGDYEIEPRFSAGAWRFTAVQLGGVERILTLLRQHLRDNAAGNSAIHRARFGNALAATRSAYLWVREAALRAESKDAGASEVSFVLMTRGVVERAGLEVMEAAARSIGTRAFFTDNPIDLACRDLALYLRQPVPDEALDRASAAFLDHDCWQDDPLW